MNPLSLILFTAAWIVFIYLLNCLIAGEFKKIEFMPALVYIATVSMIGVFGEVFLDSVYNFFVGVPLWVYNILPIHHGYTSYYAVVVWGMYGFHLYLLHGSLSSRWSITRVRHLALILSVEALVVEAALTLSAKYSLGKYIYYYSPSDLWHVTSLQNIPFYFICGVVIAKTMKRFRKEPAFYILICLFLTFVFVFLGN